MVHPKIVIQLKNALHEEENLLFTDFLEQLKAISSTLTQVDNYITKNEKASVRYRLFDLSHASPATVVLQAEPVASVDNCFIVINGFFHGMKSILTGTVPHDYTYTLLESFKKIGNKLHNHTELNLMWENESLEVNGRLVKAVEELLGEDEIIEESMSGTLEMLNLHGKRKLFRIYPVLGPEKVDCYFPHRLEKKAIAGINRYVNVEGKFKYKNRFPYPYEARVTEIEIYPDEDTLPTLGALRGIAPNATGKLSSEEFIRRMRDNEW